MGGQGGPPGVIVIVLTCALAAAAATAGTVTWNRGRPKRRMLGVSTRKAVLQHLFPSTKSPGTLFLTGVGCDGFHPPRAHACVAPLR